VNRIMVITDVTSFEVFSHTVKKALRSQGACEVERIIGITDFKKTMDCFNDIHGITAAHAFRITAKPDGAGVDVFYQSDVGKPGWFPRPAPAILCDVWRTMFEHPISPINQGYPIRGDVYALTAPGRRQEWKYVIEYFGGTSKVLYDHAYRCHLLI